MRLTLFLLVSSLIVMAVRGCGTPTDSANSDCTFLYGENYGALANEQGTIDLLWEDGVYLFIPDCDPNLGFAVTSVGLEEDNLPDAFRKDGARVILSGTLVPIPPHARLPAQPLKITAIQAAAR